MKDGQPRTVLRVFQSKAETRRFYDKIARVYDILAERSEEPVRRAGLELLDAKPGEKVLEVGFGTGHSLVPLAGAVGDEGKVYGLDISPEMRKLARQRLVAAKLASRALLATGDATSLKFTDRAFDGVFMSFTLELFDTDEIPRVLAECRRVLKPGGRIVVVGISCEGGDGLILRAFEWTHRHFPNLLDCRPIYVRKSLEQAGFRIARTARRKMWVQVEIVKGIKVEDPADTLR